CKSATSIQSLPPSISATGNGSRDISAGRNFAIGTLNFDCYWNSIKQFALGVSMYTTPQEDFPKLPRGREKWELSIYEGSIPHNIFFSTPVNSSPGQYPLAILLDQRDSETNL
ncbi:hypothetical protein SFRURICE_005135, partial [Spodoptera frugiperda]